MPFGDTFRALPPGLDPRVHESQPQSQPQSQLSSGSQPHASQTSRASKSPAPTRQRSPLGVPSTPASPPIANSTKARHALENLRSSLLAPKPSPPVSSRHEQAACLPLKATQRQHSTPPRMPSHRVTSLSNETAQSFANYHSASGGSTSGVSSVGTLPTMVAMYQKKLDDMEQRLLSSDEQNGELLEKISHLTDVMCQVRDDAQQVEETNGELAEANRILELEAATLHRQAKGTADSHEGEVAHMHAVVRELQLAKQHEVQLLKDELSSSHTNSIAMGQSYSELSIENRHLTTVLRKKELRSLEESENTARQRLEHHCTDRTAKITSLQRFVREGLAGVMRSRFSVLERHARLGGVRRTTAEGKLAEATTLLLSLGSQAEEGAPVTDHISSVTLSYETALQEKDTQIQAMHSTIASVSAVLRHAPPAGVSSGDCASFEKEMERQMHCMVSSIQLAENELVALQQQNQELAEAALHGSGSAGVPFAEVLSRIHEGNTMLEGVQREVDKAVEAGLLKDSSAPLSQNVAVLASQIDALGKRKSIVETILSQLTELLACPEGGIVERVEAVLLGNEEGKKAEGALKVANGLLKSLSYVFGSASEGATFLQDVTEQHRSGEAAKNSLHATEAMKKSLMEEFHKAEETARDAEQALLRSGIELDSCKKSFAQLGLLLDIEPTQDLPFLIQKIKDKAQDASSALRNEGSFDGFKSNLLEKLSASEAKSAQAEGHAVELQVELEKTRSMLATETSSATSAKQRADTAEERLGVVEAELLTHQLDVDKLRSALNEEQSVHNSMKVRADSVGRDTDTLRRENEVLRRQSSDVAQKSQRHEEDSLILSRDVSAANKRIAELEDELSLLKRLHADASRTATRLEMLQGSTEKDRDALKSKLLSTESSLSELRRETLSRPTSDQLQTLEKDIIDSSKKLQDRSDECRALQRRCSELEDERERFGVEREALETRLFTEKQRLRGQHERIEGELGQTITDLTCEVATQKKLVSNTDTEKQRLKSQHEQIEADLGKTITDLTSELDVQKKLLSNSDIEKKDLRQNLVEMTTELEQQTQDNTTLLASNAELRDDLVVAMQEQTSLTPAIEEMKSKLEDAESRIIVQTEQMNALKKVSSLKEGDMVETLRTELSEKTQRLTQMEAELQGKEKTLQEIQIQSTDCTNLKLQVQAAEEAVLKEQTLKSNTEEWLQSALNEAQKEIEVLKPEILRLESELLTHHASINEVDAVHFSLTQLQNDHSVLIDRFEALQADEQSLQEQIVSERNLVSDAQRQLEDTQRQLESKVSLLESLKSRHNASTETITTLTEELDTLRSEISDVLQPTIQQLNTDLRDSRRKAQESLAAEMHAKEDLDTSRTEEEGLNTKLHSLQSEIRSLQRELRQKEVAVEDALRDAATALQETTDAREENNRKTEALKRKLNASEERCTTLEAEHSEVLDRLSEEENVMQTLRHKNTRLEASYAREEVKVEVLEDEIKALQPYQEICQNLANQFAEGDNTPNLADRILASHTSWKKTLSDAVAKCGPLLTTLGHNVPFANSMGEVVDVAGSVLMRVAEIENVGKERRMSGVSNMDDVDTATQISLDSFDDPVAADLFGKLQERCRDVETQRDALRLQADALRASLRSHGLDAEIEDNAAGGGSAGEEQDFLLELLTRQVAHSEEKIKELEAEVVTLRCSSPGGGGGGGGGDAENMDHLDRLMQAANEKVAFLEKEAEQRREEERLIQEQLRSTLKRTSGDAGETDNTSTMDLLSEVEASHNAALIELRSVLGDTQIHSDALQHLINVLQMILHRANVTTRQYAQSPTPPQPETIESAMRMIEQALEDLDSRWDAKVSGLEDDLRRVAEDSTDGILVESEETQTLHECILRLETELSESQQINTMLRSKLQDCERNRSTSPPVATPRRSMTPIPPELIAMRAELEELTEERNLLATHSNTLLSISVGKDMLGTLGTLGIAQSCIMLNPPELPAPLSSKVSLDGSQMGAVQSAYGSKLQMPHVSETESVSSFTSVDMGELKKRLLQAEALAQTTQGDVQNKLDCVEAELVACRRQLREALGRVKEMEEYAAHLQEVETDGELRRTQQQLRHATERLTALEVERDELERRLSDEKSDSLSMLDIEDKDKESQDSLLRELRAEKLRAEAAATAIMQECDRLRSDQHSSLKEVIAPLQEEAQRLESSVEEVRQAFPYPQPQSMEKTFHTPLSVMDEVADLVSTLPDVARLDVIIDALCTSCTQLGVAKGWAEAIESGEATQPEPVVQSSVQPIFTHNDVQNLSELQITDTELVVKDSSTYKRRLAVVVQLPNGWWVADTQAHCGALTGSQVETLNTAILAMQDADTRRRYIPLIGEGACPDGVTGASVEQAMAISCQRLFNTQDETAPLQSLQAGLPDSLPTLFPSILLLSDALGQSFPDAVVTLATATASELKKLLNATVDPALLQALLKVEDESVVQAPAILSICSEVAKQVFTQEAGSSGAVLGWTPFAALLTAVLTTKHEYEFPVMYRCVRVSRDVWNDHKDLTKGTGYAWPAPVLCNLSESHVEDTMRDLHNDARRGDIVAFKLRNIQRGTRVPTRPTEVVLPPFNAFTVDTVEAIPLEGSARLLLLVTLCGGDQGGCTAVMTEPDAMTYVGFCKSDLIRLSQRNEDSPRSGSIVLPLCGLGVEQTAHNLFDAELKRLENSLTQERARTQQLRGELKAGNTDKIHDTNTPGRAPLAEALTALTHKVDTVKRASKDLRAIARTNPEKTRELSLLLTAVDEAHTLGRTLCANTLTPVEKAHPVAVSPSPRRDVGGTAVVATRKAMNPLGSKKEKERQARAASVSNSPETRWK